MRVGFIITCFNREAHWPHLRRIIGGFSKIQPCLVYCYNGADPEHPCDVRLRNPGLSAGDFQLTLAGYRELNERYLSDPLARFVKLSVDSWPCDEDALIAILERMASTQACYAGNLWHRNAGGSLSTDIFFADTRFGNIFSQLAAQGHHQDFEISMARAVNCVGRASLIAERHPVHPSNRWRCDKLKWTMSHKLDVNIAYATKALSK